MADLRGIDIEDGHDVEPPLAETAVLHQGTADLPRPDHGHPVAPLEPEDLAQPTGELGHRVAQPALPERAEERQVFPNLRRGRPPPGRQRLGADRIDPLLFEFFQESQIEREAANRAVGDFAHAPLL